MRTRPVHPYVRESMTNMSLAPPPLTGHPHDTSMGGHSQLLLVENGSLGICHQAVLAVDVGPKAIAQLHFWHSTERRRPAPIHL